jgi:hypothetical protein
MTISTKLDNALGRYKEIHDIRLRISDLQLTLKEANQDLIRHLVQQEMFDFLTVNFSRLERAKREM